MSSNNDGRGANTSYALTTFEKRTLAETRSFTQECRSKIAGNQKNVAALGRFGLWWDAKGLFNCSNAEEVIADMEKYNSIFKEIDAFFAQVEKGDPQENYDRLLALCEKISEKERDAERNVKNNLSKSTCRLLREFLDEMKNNLEHNMKKVECIILRQRNHAVEQTCKSAIRSANEMSKKMNQLIEENRAVRKETAEKLKKVLEEAEKGSEARIRKMKEESDQAMEENNRRWETRMEEVVEQNKLMLKNMSKMLEAMNLS